jgi:hypothetical protein
MSKPLPESGVRPGLMGLGPEAAEGWSRNKQYL